MNTLENNKGITLTTLAITVVIMAILGGITIYIGTDSINLAKLKAFNSELEIIQTKVDEMAEYQLTDEEQKNYGQDIKAQPNSVQSKINTALAGKSSERI